jgi:transcriptional regulator with XRE-family HTH domain
MAHGKVNRPSRVHRETSRFKREARALGARVRALRHAAGWTLAQTAERCDLDWKHLQKVEAGTLNFTFVTLVRLAVGFRKSVSTFFRPRRTKREREGATFPAMTTAPKPSAAR